MYRLLFVLGIVTLWSMPTLAGSINEYKADAWMTITAPNDPSLIEKINVSFLYFNGSPDDSDKLFDGAGIVAGTLKVTSSGFLGTFSPYDPNGIGVLGMPLDAANDYEMIELYPSIYANIPEITPGKNTVGFNFMDCDTAICTTEYGRTWVEGNYYPTGIQQGSVVTAVNVPDGDSSLLLSFSVLGVFALALRWRRREI
jgi:hypothetical protein